MEIKNAKIRYTTLGREDHGIMTFRTFMIYIDTGAFICGVGGYCLNEFNAESMEAISKILEVVGVDKWEDLPGKHIRVEYNGLGSTVTKIGNITEEKWLDLEEFFVKVVERYGTMSKKRN